MGFRGICLTGFVLMILQGLAAAQGYGVGVEGAVPQQAPPPKIETELMPIDKFDNLPLAEVLKIVHEKMPEFNSVVVRAPGARDDYPVIPQMSVKNVTIGQFLEFVKASYPGVDVKRIDGAAGPLYVVQITGGPLDQPNFGGFPGGGFGGGVVPGGMAGLPGAAGPPPGPPPNVVQVYRLNDIVASLAAGKEGDPRELNRAGLADILSLVQIALEESGEKETVILKVHEQTQTLLFKGSPFKQAVLEQVLNTLRPSQDPIQGRQLAELRDQVRLYEAQREVERVRHDESARSHEKDMDELRMRLRDAQKTLEESQMNNMELKAQIEQARRAAR
jgi:hypothetical protein